MALGYPALGTVVVWAVPAIGSAAAGLQAMRELSLIALGDCRDLPLVEGRAFIVGGISGSPLRIGGGNPAQGQARSTRPTLTVGGSARADVEVDNGPAGADPLLAPLSYGVAIAGDGGCVTLARPGGVVTVGGDLGCMRTGAASTVTVAGGIADDIDLADDVTVAVGGSVARVFGGSRARLDVGGDVAHLAFGPGSFARIGGRLISASLAGNSFVEIVGTLGDAEVGDRAVVKSGAAAGPVQGRTGATVYAAGAISGEANGARFSPFHIYGAIVTPPSPPPLPDARDLAAETPQLAANIAALSDALAALALSPNPSRIERNGAALAVHAVDAGNGYALLDLDATALAADTIEYHFPDATLPVVVTVGDEGAIDWLAEAAGIARAHNQQLIWHFPYALRLDLPRRVHGSVLAPRAVVSGGEVEGTLVAAAVDGLRAVRLGSYAASGGFIGEIDGHPYNRPLPGPWALLVPR